MKAIWSIIVSIFLIYKIFQVIGDPSKRKIAGLIILIIFVIGLFIYLLQVKKESDFKQKWNKQQNIENECVDEALAKSDIYIYMEKYANGYHKTQIIDSLYKTEDELWKLILEFKTKDSLTVSKLNKKYCDIDMYEYYLERYPSGKYSEKAKKAIIDLRVDEIANFPSVEEMFGDSTKTAVIHITNATGRTINILYSGKIVSKEIHMPFNRDKLNTTIILPRGKYRMVILGGTGSFINNYSEIKDYSYSSSYTEMWRKE